MFLCLAVIRRVKLDPADSWDKAKTVGSEAQTLWSVREPERVSALAYLAPHLMTYEEQQIWAVVRENGYFWRGRFVDDGEEEVWVWDCGERSLLSDRLAQHWDRIVAVASGEAAVTTLPPWQHKRPSKSSPDHDPLDDEVPF
jgi:hypothetical protein